MTSSFASLIPMMNLTTSNPGVNFRIIRVLIQMLGSKGRGNPPIYFADFPIPIPISNISRRFPMCLCHVWWQRMTAWYKSLTNPRMLMNPDHHNGFGADQKKSPDPSGSCGWRSWLFMRRSREGMGTAMLWPQKFWNGMCSFPVIQVIGSGWKSHKIPSVLFRCFRKPPLSRVPWAPLKNTKTLKRHI